MLVLLISKKFQNEKLLKRKQNFRKDLIKLEESKGAEVT